MSKNQKISYIYDNLKIPNIRIDQALYYYIESFLRLKLHASVRSIYGTDDFYLFDIDLKKELDEKIQNCLFFLIPPFPAKSIREFAELAEKIKFAMVKEGLNDQSNIIIFFSSEKDQIELLQDFFSNCVLIQDKHINGFLESLDRKKILKLIKKRSITMADCPFIFLGPCDPDMFVGRVQLINEILQSDQCAFAIAGGRRIGKSSLQFKLMEESKKLKFKNRAYKTLYLDCCTFTSFSSFLNEIGRRLFPNYYYRQYNFFTNNISKLKNCKC